MTTLPPPNPHPALSLLSHAHSPTTASTLFTTKIQQKPLILRPTSPDPNSQDARSTRRAARLRKKSHARAKQRPKPLSAKEKRVLGVYEMRPEEVKWEVWKGLWRMWVGYAWEVLGLRVPAEGEGRGKGACLKAVSVGPIVASMDFHGAEVEVVRSACVGRVGTRGIVVRETKFTVVVVTRGDVMRTIPKKGTIFRTEIPQPTTRGSEPFDVDAYRDATKDGLPNLVFELHGSSIECRPADRATRKFKPRRMDL